MNEVINSFLTAFNSIGRGFCDYTAGIFVQSSVLIVLLLIIDFILRKRVRAVFRYCVWMLVFVKLILPPTLSLPTGIGYWYGYYLSANSPVLQQVSNVVRPEPAGTLAPEDFALAAEIPQDQPSQINPQIAAPVTSGVSGLNAITWQAFVFLLWLVGVLVISVLLIQRMLFVKGLIAQSEPAKNRLPDMLNQCRRKVGIRRNIKLRLSNNISCPAVCGLFKPVILIPTALLEKLSPDRLRAVLLHELFHVKRGDLWVNLVQTVLQIIYFYNPFVWLANAVVRRIREQAVDEMVLVALGTGAKSYSNTLIDIAEMAFWKTSLSLRLIGVVESKKALHRRIRHMLNRPIPKSAKLSVVSLFAIIVAGIVLLPMARGERKLQNPVRLDENDRPIITHTLYMWGKVENPVYQLEGTIYHDVNKVVARIGELMKQDPFPMIRVRTTSKFQRQQEPIENFGKRCRDIGFINIEYKYDLSIPIGTFQVILPDGVTVELVGVTNHYIQSERPAEKTWWFPNGEVLEKMPYAKLDWSATTDYRNLNYEFAIRLNDKTDYTYAAGTSLNRSLGFPKIPKTKNDEFLPNMRAFIGEFRKEDREGNIHFGVATGRWEKVDEWDKQRWAVGEPDNVNITSGKSVILIWPRQKGNAVVSEVIHTFQEEATRLLLIDKNDNIHETGHSIVGEGSGLERNVYYFWNIKREDIKKFEFQKRPYEWVTFKNVSLRPGVKTNVQVDGGQLSEKTDEHLAKPFSSEDLAEENKPKIIFRASVFSVRTPPSSITNFLYNELGLKNTPIVNLTDAQAEQFKKRMASIPNTTTVTSPTAIVFDRQPADLSVTTQHEYTVDYEESADSPAEYKPKRKKFTTGVELNFTPELKQDKNLIILTLNVKKTDIVKLKSKLHPSGNQIQIPVIQTAETHTTVAVPQGKYLLAILSGMSSMGNSNQPDKPVQQTILLVKAEVQVEVEKH